MKLCKLPAFLSIVTIILLSQETPSLGGKGSGNTHHQKEEIDEKSLARTLKNTKALSLQSEEQEPEGIYKLSSELLEHIFSFFTFSESVNAAPTCRLLRNLSYNAPVWRQLIHQSNIYWNPEGDRLARDVFFTNVAYNPYAQLTLAKFYMDEKYFKSNPLQAYHLYSNVASNPKVSVEMRGDARLTAISVKLFSSRSEIDPSDVSAHALLKELSLWNPEGVRQHWVRAILLRAKWCLHHPKSSKEDKEILSLLQDVRRVRVFQPEATDQAKADFLSVRFMLEGRVTHEAADVCLQAVKKDNNISEEIRMEAELLLAKMKIEEEEWYNDGTMTNVTHEEAFDYLQAIEQYKVRLPKELCIEASCLKAKMRVENRTTKISDEEAFDLLQSVRNNLKAPMRIWSEANILLAQMRVETRTTKISDEEAFKLAEEQEEKRDSALIPWIKGGLLMAKLHFQGRTTQIDDKKACSLLDRAIKSWNVPENIRIEAQSLMEAHKKD